jgi:hypothetical protein
MSAHKSHVSARSHHTSTSHRTRPKDDDLESNAPPESVASFAAPTVIPGDSVSQAGGRSHHARHSSRHSHHSSRPQSNADWDEASSGLLTEQNLEAHNAESRSRASTPRPPEQLYVEVVEDRTATGSYYSYDETPRQSLHPQDAASRSHHSSRAPSHRVEALSRAMDERLSVSRAEKSVHGSHRSRSHVSRTSERYEGSHASRSHVSKSSERRSSSHSPGSATTSKPLTVISRRNDSHSPVRSSASHHSSHSRSHSRSRAPTSTPSHVSSYTSQRTVRKESPPRVSTPRSREVYEVAVYQEVPRQSSGIRETYTIEVEAAEDQAEERGYRIHYRHQYPVNGEA